MRTREDQTIRLREDLSGDEAWIANPLAVARAHILEAEQRGAAQERERLALGAEQVGWVERQSAFGVRFCRPAALGDTPFAIIEMRDRKSGAYNTPLYATPPNTQAALNDARREVERLREALEYYANPKIYECHPHGLGFDRRDKSWVARAALAPQPTAQEVK